MSHFILPPFCTDDVLRNVRNLRGDDIPLLFIASWPKSGTTWMQSIVYHILTMDAESEPLSHISDVSPFAEHTKNWEVDGSVSVSCRSNHRRLGWQVFNTHLMPLHLPYGQAAMTMEHATSPVKSTPSAAASTAKSTIKCIYVTRNGRDAAASFYHHLRNQCGDGGIEQDTPFAAYLADWCGGRGIYGSWLHHLEAWQNCAGRDVLYVRYEDLINDLRRELLRVNTFLRGTALDDTQLAALQQKVAFHTMRADNKLYAPISVKWRPGFDFFRQGVSHGNAALFGPAENTIFETMVKEYLASKNVTDVPPWLTALNVL